MAQSTAVRVRLVPYSGLEMNDRGIHVEVQVQSVLKPSFWARGDKKVNRNMSMTDLSTAIEVLTGAAAEYLCQNYGDRIDPTDCAKKAVEIFKSMKRAFEDGDIDKLTTGVTIQ